MRLDSLYVDDNSLKCDVYLFLPIQFVFTMLFLFVFSLHVSKH